MSDDARPTEAAPLVSCGSLATLLVVGLVLLYALIPMPHGNSPLAYRAMAVGALKSLTAAQALFREGDRERDGTLDYGTLAELSQGQLVDEVLGTGTKNHYAFVCRAAPGATRSRRGSPPRTRSRWARPRTCPPSS
ncbi:MAG: hypothetical protein AB7N76_13675 [Planctomycetota bacterium]